MTIYSCSVVFNKEESREIRMKVKPNITSREKSKKEREKREDGKNICILAYDIVVYIMVKESKRSEKKVVNHNHVIIHTKIVFKRGFMKSPSKMVEVGC